MMVRRRRKEMVVLVVVVLLMVVAVAVVVVEVLERRRERRIGQDRLGAGVMRGWLKAIIQGGHLGGTFNRGGDDHARTHRRRRGLEKKMGGWGVKTSKLFGLSSQ